MKLKESVEFDGHVNFEEQNEVGAYDDRAPTGMNGFASNGIAGSRKKGKSELLAQLSELIAELAVAD